LQKNPTKIGGSRQSSRKRGASWQMLKLGSHVDGGRAGLCLKVIKDRQEKQLRQVPMHRRGGKVRGAGERNDGREELKSKGLPKVVQSCKEN